MKRHAMFTVVGCLGMVLGVAGMARSGIPSAHQPVLNKVARDIRVSKSTHPRRKKPDLTPTNIKAVQQGQGTCYLQVTMRNNGPGIIPNTVWTNNRVGVQMYNDNRMGTV